MIKVFENSRNITKFNVISAELYPIPNYGKEIYIWCNRDYPFKTFHTVNETYEWINYMKSRTVKSYSIHTTCIHFCSTKWLVNGYKLFVHLLNKECIEIKLGDNECTGMYIREGHNLEKLLLAGEFGEIIDK